MDAAFLVLADGMLLSYIVEFLPSLSYALHQLEPLVYESEALLKHPTRTLIRWPSLIQHAILTENTRLAEQLFRMRAQPYYAAMPHFAIIDGILELVCKRGSVRSFQLLHDRPEVASVWPRYLLQRTIDALKDCYRADAFTDRQKEKAQWLMTHHPEACTSTKRACVPEILVSLREYRDLFLQLLAARALDLSTFPMSDCVNLDVAMLELLLQGDPSAVTRELVECCASGGNMEAIKFIHDHASELRDDIFTASTMDLAAESGRLDVVRFLHENRMEGCSRSAMTKAAMGGHLDVVKFLHENRWGGCLEGALASSVRLGSLDHEVLEYMATHRPEAVGDPTTWHLNDDVKIAQSAWANRAAVSGDPVLALRAAVIQLTDLEAFKLVHEQYHPAGCVSARDDGRQLLQSRPGREQSDKNSLLRLAIYTEKDDFAIYLVNNCERVEASIDYVELRAVGSKWRPLNLELLDLLMGKRPRDQDAEGEYERLIVDAAMTSSLPFVMALLARGVPCSEKVLEDAFDSDTMEVAEYLMDEYPELITMGTMDQVISNGMFQRLLKLCESHPHLVDCYEFYRILCGKSADVCTTWDVLRTLYKRGPSEKLIKETLDFVWQGGTGSALAFMWLVWRDPRIAATITQADRVDRLRLYTEVRKTVPSLLKDAPVKHLPWWHQLRLLRERVDSGQLTFADVERARELKDATQDY